MSLKAPILKILNRKYSPYILVECTFRQYDVFFKTDAKGNAVMSFLGRKTNKGNIKGEHYVRRLVYDGSEKILKDHWGKRGRINNI